MADVPPPPTGPSSGPQAGWYSDPTGNGLRWWDGSSWTDAVTAAGGQPVVTAQSGSAAILSPTGDWLGRSFRLAVSSLGGHMPVILFAVIPWFMALAVCVWYGLRDGSMVADFETGNVGFEGLDGRLRFVVAGAAVTTMAFLGLRLLYTTASRGVAAAHRLDGGSATEATPTPDPEADHDSGIGAAARRWPSVSGVTVTRAAVYGVLYLAGSTLALVQPLLVLLLPVAVVAIVWFWTRFVLSNVVAADSGGWRRPFTEARQATAGRSMAVFGRLLALAVIGASLLIVTNVVGGIASAVTGSQPEAAVEPFAERVAFNDVLPSNPAALALSWVFMAIGVGLWQILSATAHTLLFLDLRGELAPEPERANPADEPGHNT